MTKAEVKLQKKATALNAIRKIYHPLTKNHYSQWTDESYAEQRDYWVCRLIEQLEKDLRDLK